MNPSFLFFVANLTQNAKPQPFASHPGPAVWEKLYFLDVATCSLQFIAETPDYFNGWEDFQFIDDPIFSIDGDTTLVCMWSCGRAVEHLRLCQRSGSSWKCKAASIRKYTVDKGRLIISPDSRYIAAFTSKDIMLLSLDLVTLRRIPFDDCKDPVYTAAMCKFSPTGALLSFFDYEAAEIDVYDCTAWRRVAFITSQSLPGGRKFDVYTCNSNSTYEIGLTHGVFVHSQHDRCEVLIAPISASALANGMQADSFAPAQISSSRCHTYTTRLPEGATHSLHLNNALCGFSPGGAFVAIAGPGCQVVVLQCRTGDCMLQRMLDIPAAPHAPSAPLFIHAGVEQLMWLPSGRAILAHCKVDAKYDVPGTSQNAGRYRWTRNVICRLELG